MAPGVFTSRPSVPLYLHSFVSGQAEERGCAPVQNTVRSPPGDTADTAARLEPFGLFAIEGPPGLVLLLRALYQGFRLIGH